VSYLQHARALALSFDGAWEDYPWEPTNPVYKTAKGKIFLFAGEREDGAATLTVKLTPDEGAAALLLPFVSIAPYVGRYGWVTATVATDVEWDIASPWVERSYELVTRPPRRPQNR